MAIRTPRITLRDFENDDRTAFIAYQMDPRYRRLYDFSDDPQRAGELFDLFLGWQVEKRRRNFQVGIFDTATDRLCGCAGLRGRPEDNETAVLGIELAPSDWGRYRIALDAASCLVEYGFTALRLRMIIGDTASGNKRVAKIARWFGARIVDVREGPEWMRARGWQEVDWALTDDEWQRSDRRRMFIGQFD
jgi:[ribosomal protein S5]-alanine N-acetyltransferase